jgi:ribosomal protein L11 methyltransferase
LGKLWPAFEVSVRDAADADLVLAAADDYSPTAVDERDGALRIFFSTAESRDRAVAALRDHFTLTHVDVDDEDWARRGHGDLSPVVVGRVTVSPAPPGHPAVPASAAERGDRIDIVIPPSMGFGTGHHATTRLCLAALQSLDVRGKSVLDVGTGSGLLAIAAVKLGAAIAVGTDDDEDAIHAASENVALNGVTTVNLVVSDVMNDPLPAADVVVANLTGALIVRAASRLVAAMKPGGVLILSGVLASERDDILGAFTNQTVIDLVQEDEWLGFTLESAR